MEVQVPQQRRGEAVPRGALLGAGALVLLTLLLTIATRVTDIGATHVPKSAMVAAVDITFVDEPNGAVTVLRVADRKVIGTFAPGTNGFARSTVRGLVRERRRESVGAEPPFRLTRWADGRLSLSDPATGRNVELDVFGPTNVAIFAQLLVAGTT